VNASEHTIDLNADLGEGFPNDQALLARVTSASISCGAHAGDRGTILETLREAKARGVQVGAHPGYPDREGFGRREQSMSAEAVERLILAQFDELAALADEVGLTLRYVKPHGALYNQAQRQVVIAEGVIGAVARLGLPVLGQPGSVVEDQARAADVRFVAEGFPDRRYRPDGRLVARSEPDAVLSDLAEVEAQVVRLVEQGVIRTLCIHGDDPSAVANADTIRAALERHGIGTKRF
jgi:5-oxoprolinase (ATP-hydrolysing) subunit A